MRTVTIDIPALRDPFLVSEVLSGATPRIDAIETLEDLLDAHRRRVLPDVSGRQIDLFGRLAR